MDEQNTPMPVSGTPAPTSPPTVVLAPKPVTSKRWIWFVLLGIVVLAGAAYAWLWLSPAAPAATPTPTPSASATTDPTAGWKTYTNTQYGFEVKYPRLLIDIRNEDKGASPASSLSYDFIFIPTANPDASLMFYVYESTTLEQAMTLSQFAAQAVASSSSRSVVTLGTADAMKISFVKGSLKLGGSGWLLQNKDIYLLKNRNYYLLMQQQGALNSEHTDLFTQILSTFKFTP